MTGIHQALAAANSINLQLESVSSGTEGATTTSHVVTLPTLLAGRLVSVIWAHRGGAVNITKPTGWNITWNNLSNGDNQLWGMFYRVCDGSEGATVTFTSASAVRAAWLVYSFVNPILTTMNAATDFLSPPPANTTPDPPLYNDSSTYSGSIGTVLISNTSATNGINSYPTSWDQGQISVSGGFNTTGFILAGAYRFNEAVAQDPGAYSTASSQQTAAATIVVR